MQDIKIKDDVYMEITNEFDQIRTALGMYISKTGTDGALHLIKEMVNNAFDEAVNPESLSSKFDVVFDEVAQKVSVIDYSRGIPFDKLLDVCTKKHTSTKFIRKDSKMKEQCGRNGVGLVVTAACSEYFRMVSKRGKQKKVVEIIKGEIVDHAVENMKKEEYGLEVTMIPSSEYLKGNVILEPYMIENYLRKMAYVMREDIKINLIMFTKDQKNKDYADGKPASVTQYHRLGLAENVRYLSNSLEFNPIEVSAITDAFDLELSFSYDKTIDDTIIDSYCNYVNTTEGGNHVVVAQRAICDFFSREAKKIDPNSKFEVTFEDCRKGLVFSVNCKHIDPAYEGQHKTRVSNDDVLKEGKGHLIKALYSYFNSNNTLLRKIITYLRTIVKARLEANKIKGVTTKKQTTFLDDAEIRMFYPLADRNTTGYSELYIVEGDSAGTQTDTARNSKFQAILGVMGVVNNVHGMTYIDIMKKTKIFATITNILGCGIDKTFDITKLKYNKIIIEADADTDGNNITSLLLLFFVKFMPELILQGKLYKALPPLIILDEKTKKYGNKSLLRYSKEDYYDLINTIISENVDIAIPTSADIDEKSVDVLTKKEAFRWLKLNSDYSLELGRLYDRTACNTDILEFICYAFLLYQHNEDKAIKMITKKFNELEYNDAFSAFSGSYDGEAIFVIIDSIFWQAAKPFMKILANNTNLYIYTKNKNEKHNDAMECSTIGTFLSQMASAYPVSISQRYKGIGEMDAKVIFETVLNPKTRKLVRFNMDNIKETLERFDMLHGKSEAYREARRQLLDDAEISYMDLDN